MAENFDHKFANLSCSNDPVCHACCSVTGRHIFLTCVCSRCVTDQDKTKLIIHCNLQYLMNHTSSDLVHPVPSISYAMQINTSIFHNSCVCRFDDNFRCNFCWCFPCHSQSHVRTILLSANMWIHCLCPVWTSNIISIPCILLQITIHKITLNYFWGGHPIVLQNWKTIISSFVSVNHNNIVLFNLLAKSFGH